MHSTNRQLWRGAAYGLLAAGIWGGVYVISDQVLEVIPSFTLLTLRLILALLTLASILLAQKKLLIPRRDALILMGVGLVGGLSLGVQFEGTRLSNAVNGVIITSAAPAFIVFFAWLLLREKLTWLRLLAIFIATVGVLVATDLSKADFSSARLQGNLWLVFTALTWGAYSVLVRKVSKNYPTLTITFWALVGSLFLAVPMTFIELSRETLKPITPFVMFGVFYLGVISMALAFFLWNRAFALVEASIASLFFFAQPLVGVILAVLLLGQELTTSLIIGGVLIIAGVLLSLSKSGNMATPQATE